ncbi:MAG: YihY/virulence factor BrkB family protein [Syntrophothermus sp.]
MKNKLKEIWGFIKELVSEFSDDRATKLSAALSYYTIFSLPPLLLIIISLSAVFFGEDAVKGQLFSQINGLVGNEAARQIQDSMASVKVSGNGLFGTIIGLVVLLIGASGIFVEIQDSINFIWNLKAKPKKGFIMLIMNRLMSFSMIGVMGFLLLVSLIANSVMDVLSGKLENILSGFMVKIFYVINLALIFSIISLLFLLIFRTLPDGKVSGKASIIGAAFTAILFMVGKFAIGAYLGSSAVASGYGAGGAVILLLLWIYYSASILYLGAIFTKLYAQKYGKDIIPKPYAVRIEKSENEVEPEKTTEDLKREK